MKKYIHIGLVLFCASLFFFHSSFAQTQQTDEPLPDITLAIPENVDHVKYLGLTGKAGESFKLSDIDADILMIELFSMYCPYCQNAAPVVNELYSIMGKNPPQDIKMVIIGIGANNTDLEVKTFQEGFDIQFPMFSDPDMAIYKALAGKGTPTFIGCKRDNGNNHIIFLRKSGGFRNARLFFKNLLDKSGVKPVQ